MVKYDKKYYDEINYKYGYSKVEKLPLVDSDSVKLKWLSGMNVENITERSVLNKNTLVLMGIGVNDVPHLGTLSQILKVLYLQNLGYKTQIILGDLDVYGARNVSVENAKLIVDSYKKFIKSLGYDVSNGALRTQSEREDILKTSYLLSSYVFFEDFNEVREDIYDYYQVQHIIDDLNFNMMQSINLMFADFIHPCLFENIDNVLISCGIDEHLYVWKSNQIMNRMGINNKSISGIFSRIIMGLNDMPKMSKSVKNSSLNLSNSIDDFNKFFSSSCNDYIIYNIMKELDICGNGCEYQNVVDFSSIQWKNMKNDFLVRMLNILKCWKYAENGETYNIKLVRKL